MQLRGPDLHVTTNIELIIECVGAAHVVKHDSCWHRDMIDQSNYQSLHHRSIEAERIATVGRIWFVSCLGDGAKDIPVMDLQSPSLIVFLVVKESLSLRAALVQNTEIRKGND